MLTVRSIVIALRNGLVSAFLAIPLLLWVPRSLAANPPITPAYLACAKGGIANICQGAWGIIEGAAPGSNYVSQSIGYIDTTSIAGTQAAYFACTKNSFTGLCSGNYLIIRGAAPNPNSYVYSLIGYAFTTQVSGSQAVYLACTRGGIASICTGNYTILKGAAPNPNTYVSWFIGYIYPTVPVTTYTGIPKYYIGSVVYVPPGPGSSIQYGVGTNTGTTLSMTQSFTQSVSAGASEGTPKGSGTANANVSVNVGNDFGGSTMTSTDIELTDNATDTYQAPSSDLLNHDYDQILLFFGVTVKENVDYYGHTTWGVSFASLNNTNNAASGYPVAVGCLRANSTIPVAQCTGTLAFLTSMNITSADYASIMNADPFANPSGSQVPASSRFVKLNAFSFFGDPTSVTYTYGVVNSTTTTNGVTTSYSYSVGFSGSLFGVSLGNKVTYTNSSTTSNKTMSTGTSVLSLRMPSPSYVGPTTLNVYEDTVYKTFMFSFH